MTKRLCFLSALAAFCVIGTANHAVAQDARYHDGFYLRLGGGFGFISDHVEADEIDAEGTVKGATAVGELALGGAASPGLILGGGIYTHWLPEPESVDAELGTIDVGDVEFDDSELHVIGFLIDYYTNPHAGFHIQGVIGYAAGRLGAGEGNLFGLEEHRGGGVGVVGGIGYEWWVARAWGLGFLGRLTLAWFSGEDDNDIEWSHFAIAPALLFTATLN